MSPKEIPKKKAIHFDLITSELKKVYKSNNPFVYIQAYKQINRFFKQHGFEHRQWSGYVSKEPMLDISVSKLIYKLNDSMPWLRDCVRKFDVTNIGKTYDLTYIFKENNEEKVKPLINKQIKINANMKVSKKAFYFESRINRKNVNKDITKKSRNRKKDWEL